MKPENSAKLLIEQLVNTDAYAQSINFVGYSEAVSHRASIVPRAIKYFLDFWSIEEIRRSYVVSHINRNILIDEVSVEMQNTLSFLAVNKWIHSSFEEEESMASLDERSLKRTSSEEIKHLLEAIICGYVYGQLFFVWPETELIVYPHDDCGFGVIASQENEGINFGLSFLEDMSKSPDFDVYSVRTGFPL